MAHLTRNLRHSMISDHLASVAKSVLIQYGVGGKVGPVTPRCGPVVDPATQCRQIDARHPYAAMHGVNAAPQRSDGDDDATRHLN